MKGNKAIYTASPIKSHIENSITAKAAAQIAAAVEIIEKTPNNSLFSSPKVKKVGNNIYSYRINMKNRLLFGCKDDKCILLDVVNIDNLRQKYNRINIKNYKT